MNETDRFYRYFDATAHAEFLYERVEETVEYDLLHRFLAQGDGRLSKRAREKEFGMVTPEEAEAVEDLWIECHPEVR